MESGDVPGKGENRLGVAEPFRIAVLTDLHVGGTTDLGFQNPFLASDARATVGPTIDAVNREAPDLVLVTGDLTQNATEGEVAEVRMYLDRLTAPYIVCPGNHDSETAEGMQRFDETFDGATRAMTVRHVEAPGGSGLAVFGMETVWEKSGAWNEELPPLAKTSEQDIEQALRDLEDLRPSLLLVMCHFPLLSQADYVASVGGKYAGHVFGGDAILDSFVHRADAVICLVGHNHYHHVMAGERWLQIATGAIVEYPSEFRLLSVGPDDVMVETLPGAAEAVMGAKPPIAPWVAGRPEDRDFTWRPGVQLRR